MSTATVKTKMEFEARIYGRLGGSKGTYMSVLWKKPDGGVANETLCFPDGRKSQRLIIEENHFMVHFDRMKREVVVEYYPLGFLEASIPCEVVVKVQSTTGFPAAGNNKSDSLQGKM